MLLHKSQPGIKNLFELEERLVRLADDFDLKTPRSPSGIIHHLKTLPHEMISLIEHGIENLVLNFITCAETGTDPWNDRDFFIISMRSQGLTFPKDFLDHVGPGELIEGYNMQRFQIFRNLRYMEMINYSLIEVLAYEWPLLYDRSGAITEKIISYCDEVLWAANKTIPFDIPNHFIRETRSQQQKYFEIGFNHISPLFSGPNQPAGLIGSFNARTMSLEKGAETNLAFI